ncbi:RICIN domain-containing protein [Dactylosporangium siamense]|uniref:Ricin B lectin domain-containing protein n=1 Tax=Dactylosporangium siamense TaxID=685454 RepID=A0A919UAI3_9ACTN|nr:RICIN domain-containing protein [Dactylosporangium siamense]GIG48057.1 hypothetical protein Dsi01nite_060980 [Dactylosporangium siamense]
MKLRHAVVAALVCLASSAVAVLAAPQPASAAGIVPGAVLKLVNIGSGKCFLPVPQGDSNGLPVQQQTCQQGSAVQQWIFEPLGIVIFNDGEAPWYCPGCIDLGAEGYFISNLATGKCLDARDGSRSDWSVVQQWTCRDKHARSMVWYVEPGALTTTFRVRNFNSDLCLDVASGSSDDGAQLQQYHCTSGNPAQNFYQT